MKSNLKLFTGSLLSIFLILFNWKSIYPSTCFSLIFPCIVLIVISSSFIEMKMHERLCFRTCFLQSSSLLARFLANRMLVTCIHLLLALLMTISIMYSIIDYSLTTWLYLFFHTAVILYLYKKLQRLFSVTFNERFIHIFAREWAINISSVLLFLVYCIIILNDYEPRYLTADLRQTLVNASNQISSVCSITDQVLRIKIELDSWFWWMTSKASAQVESGALRTGIWTCFLFINGLAIIGINRFMGQIIYLLDRIMGARHEEF